MKSKLFSLLSLSILAVLVLTAFASAQITLSASTPSNLLPTSGSFTFTITSDVAVTDNVGFTATTITDPDGTGTISFTAIAPASFTLVAGVASAPITMSYTITDFNFAILKKYTTTLTAEGATDDTQTLTVQTPFYNGVHQSDLTISEISFTDSDLGDDEDYWYPLDDVEVEFDVEAGSYDIENIKIQACLWDNSAEKCVMDEGDMELSENKFDLDSGDDITITMTFQVDPDKLTEGNTAYTLYLKAVGKVNDDTSGYDTEETGKSYSQENLEIVTDDDFVILDNIEMTEKASCGSEIQITADVWNIGNEKQKDAYIKIVNKELGINQKVTLDDIKAMDNEQLDIIIALPDGVDEKQYDLVFSIYDDNDDVYETSRDEDKKAEFFVPLTIESCSTVPLASVSADLLSEAKAGKELEVKLTITNSDSKTSTFNLALSGYSEWAELVSMDKSAVTLNAGESQNVIVKMKIDAGISGNHNFNVDITQGEKSLSQPVSVNNIASASLFPNITGLFADVGGNNWYLWGIGALNIILVLVIIVVAARIVRKRNAAPVAEEKVSKKSSK